MSKRADPQAGTEQAAELFKVLASPLRLAILLQLDAGPMCVHELTEATGASQPLISQHLRVLRQAHLVRAEPRGREKSYAIADAHVGHIVSNALTHTQEKTS